VASVTGQRQAVVNLVSRLLVAQAAVSCAIALAYHRASGGWLLFTVVAAAAAVGLAVLVRSGSYAAWLVTLGFEACYVVIGLVTFGYASYLGGTLLAIITVGTLLRPAVARAFSSEQGGPRQRAAEQGAGDANITPSVPF
jgi:hypothetical protein